MRLLRLSSVLLLTGLLGLAGCTAHKPIPLYQLDNGTAELPTQAKGLAVLLGPVSVADYLQHETLLQRQSDSSLLAAADARWAGSLAADIDQVLLRQLAWRLDSQRTVLAPLNAEFKPDVQVQLNIIRLDSGPTYPAVLEAQWRLLDRSGQLRDSQLLRLEEAHSGTTADQVQAQSRLLQQLATRLAEAIEPLRNQQPVAEAPKPAQATPKPAKPKAEQQPQIPLVAPTRSSGEVLRF
ncbi:MULTISPECIES: PqiC family protein [Pseudomonas]|uniref:PqiC family protein n=1 Tax=Pseudomonas TaxID=286 RepID=UPI001C7F9500|nr:MULTISPECIES: PqiC family protein [Pseudomonas]MDG9926741.1 ABC-type transport auxiliary lipoprotein family protein [Pseudomonas sp. GD04042]MDH0482190.1 ABC-type transport auxiliary lipoprotein family protein [Pseudomonas sp. GD04015]MDH0603625.1 ABC-type transport auxiliary lipoprotein family protein [Pseudomonas sp. GD03869]MDH0896605.1 ABC-type transport auxiliary lipoprotein family protein [Pseudomonas sp. GD03875]MDH1066454.1 ABC-type transport auxiliary lipoprotein family protein [Ps